MCVSENEWKLINLYLFKRHYDQHRASVGAARKSTEEKLARLRSSSSSSNVIDGSLSSSYAPADCVTACGFTG